MITEHPLPLKGYDKNTVTAKIQHYCAYQERSQFEVRMKLVALGMRGDDLENVIAGLIGENFLNEERFAMAYASGKFRIKHWGRNKIKHGLRFKQVPEKLIAKALAALDGDEYERVLSELIEKKSALLKVGSEQARRQKLMEYALSKGFESDIIRELLPDV